METRPGPHCGQQGLVSVQAARFNFWQLLAGREVQNTTSLISGQKPVEGDAAVIEAP